MPGMRNGIEMLNLSSPTEAYRRVDFDARVAGGGPRDLTLLCYERLDTALGRALLAEQRRDVAGRSKALTDALAAVTALKLGLDPAHPLAAAFDTMFDNARQQLLKSVPTVDVAAVSTLRADFAELAAALRKR